MVSKTRKRKITRRKKQRGGLSLNSLFKTPTKIYQNSILKAFSEIPKVEGINLKYLVKMSTDHLNDTILKALPKQERDKDMKRTIATITENIENYKNTINKLDTTKCYVTGDYSTFLGKFIKVEPEQIKFENRTLKPEGGKELVKEIVCPTEGEQSEFLRILNLYKDDLQPRGVGSMGNESGRPGNYHEVPGKAYGIPFETYYAEKKAEAPAPLAAPQPYFSHNPGPSLPLRATPPPRPQPSLPLRATPPPRPQQLASAPPMQQSPQVYAMPLPRYVDQFGNPIPTARNGRPLIPGHPDYIKPPPIYVDQFGRRLPINQYGRPIVFR